MMRVDLRHRARWRPVLTIVVLAIVAMLPALLFDQFTRGDARFHLRWQMHFAPLFWGGEPDPRWLPAMNMGFGSPAFFLYPPLTQWAASLLAPLLPGAGFVALRLAISQTAALLLGAIGMWRWLAAAVDDDRAALFGAVVYMVLPYHLYVDIYHRAAMAELWALGVAPFAFYGVATLARGGARPVAVLTLAMAALFLSHAPSALVVVPLVVVYAAVLGWQERRLREPASAIAAALLGAILAASYLSTALTQTRFINAAALFDGRMSPLRWLIGGGAWPDTSLEPAIILINLLHLAGIAAVAWLMFRKDRAEAGRGRRLLAVLLVAVVVVTAVLQTAAARVFWTLPTPLPRIQFPWRLLTLQTIAVAAGAALMLRLAWPRRGWRILLLAAVPGLLLLDGALLGYRLHREAGRHERVPAAAALLAETRDAPEYQVGDVAALSRRFGRAKVLVLAGSGGVAVTRWSPREIALRVTGGDKRLALHQFAYSGWRYRVDDGPWQPASRTASVVSFDVPGGANRVAVQLVATAAERIGAIVQAIGLILFATWIALAARWARQGNKA